MKLQNVFEGIGKQMLLDFSQIQSQVKHPGERGSEREESLRAFLKSYLPSKYGIDSGEIVDEDGNTSKQCDIVIYDHANCPILLNGKKYRVFPAESVLAVIEVKSTLSAPQFKSAGQNIKSVKSLDRKCGSIAGVVFSYSSVWKNEPMSKACTLLEEINSSLQPSEFIDLMCILDSGVIELWDINQHTRIPSDLSERVMQVHQQMKVPTLLWFFIQLLDLLDGQTSISPNYSRYAHLFEIGLCSFRQLSEE